MEFLARKFKFQNYFEFLRKIIIKNWNFWRENSNKEFQKLNFQAKNWNFWRENSNFKTILNFYVKKSSKIGIFGAKIQIIFVPSRHQFGHLR